MSKRKVILTIMILVVVAMGIVVFMLFSGEEKTPIQRTYLSEPVMPFNKTVKVVSKNDIRFFNQRNFVSFDAINGTTRQLLGPDQEFPGIDNVKWSNDGRYVLFYANLIFESDVLGSYLLKNGLQFTTDGWWVVDLDNGEFLPLPGDTKEAYWRNTDVILLPKLDDTEFVTSARIRAFSPSDKATKPIFETSIDEAEKILKIFDTDVNVYYSVNSGNSILLKKFDEDSAETSEIIATDNDKLQISKDGGLAYYFEENLNDDVAEDASDIKGVFSIESVPQDRVISKIEEVYSSFTAAISEDNTYMLFIDRQPGQYEFKITKYTLPVSDDDISIKTELDFENNNLQLEDIMNIDVTKNFVALNTIDGLRFLDQSPHNSYKIQSIVVKGTSDGSSNFLLSQSKKDGSVDITFLVGPRDTAQAEALQFIRDQGVNPDFLEIYFDYSKLEKITAE